MMKKNYEHLSGGEGAAAAWTWSNKVTLSCVGMCARALTDLSLVICHLSLAILSRFCDLLRMEALRFCPLTLLLVVCCVLPLGENVSFAQEGSLDQQLFEELDSLSDFPQPEQDTNKTAPLSDVDQQVQRELGGEDLGQARDSNPLRMLAETMQQVQRRLRAKDLATETQQIQGRIVGDLDKLIEQMQQQQQQPQGGGQQKKQQQQQQKQQEQQQQSKSQKQKPKQKQGNKPGGKPSSQPAKDSTTQVGAAETAETSSATHDQMMQDAWGNLPASTQQEMRSARPEKFLPKYSRLIEEYFRRLAEEQKK